MRMWGKGCVTPVESSVRARTHNQDLEVANLSAGLSLGVPSLTWVGVVVLLRRASGSNIPAGLCGGTVQSAETACCCSIGSFQSREVQSVCARMREQKTRDFHQDHMQVRGRATYLSATCLTQKYKSLPPLAEESVFSRLQTLKSARINIQ